LAALKLSYIQDKNEAPLAVRRAILLRNQAIAIIKNKNNPSNKAITDHWSNYTKRCSALNTAAILAPIKQLLIDMPQTHTSPEPPWHKHRPKIDMTLANERDKNGTQQNT